MRDPPCGLESPARLAVRCAPLLGRVFSAAAPAEPGLLTPLAGRLFSVAVARGLCLCCCVCCCCCSRKRRDAEVSKTEGLAAREREEVVRLEAGEERSPPSLSLGLVRKGSTGRCLALPIPPLVAIPLPPPSLSPTSLSPTSMSLVSLCPSVCSSHRAIATPLGRLTPTLVTASSIERVERQLLFIHRSP